MSGHQSVIDRLFYLARTEAPELSLAETVDLFSAAVAGTAVAGGTAGIFSELLSLKQILVVAAGAFTLMYGVTLMQSNKQAANVSDVPVVMTPAEPGTAEEAIITTPIVVQEEESSSVEPETRAPRQPIASTTPLSTLDTEVASDTGQRDVSPVLDRARPVPTWPLAVTSQDTTIVKFTLTERSTESDFARIKEAAEKAGIKYHYRVHHERKKKTKDTWLVRDFDIDMYIPDTDISSSHRLNVPQDFVFNVEISWVAGNDGKAVALCESFVYDENGLRQK